jgi:pseudouridine-5'-phosphate glycosidase/pseudouridine kinase
VINIESQPTTESKLEVPSKVVIVGGSAVDIISKASPYSASSIRQSTVPGEVTSSLGGVGRNVAEATHRMLHSSNTLDPSPVLLISPVGNDSFGSILKNGSKSLGMRLDGLFTPDSLTSGESHRTAVCNMVLDSQGNLIGGVADMDISTSIQFKHVGLHLG